MSARELVRRCFWRPVRKLLNDYGSGPVVMLDSPDSLAKAIADAAEAKSYKVEAPAFPGGSIVEIIMGLDSFCRPAAEWLRRQWDGKDYGKVSWSFTLQHGDSGIIIVDEGDGKRKLSTAGYVAMKIANCEAAYSDTREDHDEATRVRISGISPKYGDETYGFANYYGAIRIDVYWEPIPGYRERFCYIDICVSGGKEKQDLACAAAAIAVVKEFFAKQSKRFVVFAPSDEEIAEILKAER